MGLSGALSVAQSALANSAAQSALLSRNIANVNNSDYSRKSAYTVTGVGGGVTLGGTQRATAMSLLANLLSASSSSSSAQAMSDGLTQIAQSLGLDVSSTSGDVAADRSPATLIGALTTALQQYAAAPDDASLATAALDSARALAGGLNQASTAVQAVRQQADSDIASSVATVNNLLGKFQTVNQTIVAGKALGADVSDAEDTRDGILKQLSQEIGITTVQGTNGGMSIYTDSGATLFETTARKVGFTTTPGLGTGTAGQAVTVDGVAVTGSSAIMALKTGRIAGLATLRDTTSVSYQNQLDQIASGLISAFGESDQKGGNAPTLPGLFTAPGLSAMPSSVSGLAATISINARVDPSAGGIVTRLRDGNISSDNAAYTYNASGAVGYAGRLQALGDALTSTRNFDSSSGGAATGSLATYAASSVGWLEAQRQTASDGAQYTSAVVGAATTALSNATGVNLDNEMSRMLDIEHAYQASAQLLNTVNSMFSTLIQAFG